jgi:ornithine decarboxylase
MYYIAEGKYGALGSTVSPSPRSVYKEPRLVPSPVGPCVLWGPTCDGLDKVWEGEFEVDLKEGEDWVAFLGVSGRGGMGGTAFNGFDEVRKGEKGREGRRGDEVMTLQYLPLITHRSGTG